MKYKIQDRLSKFAEDNQMHGKGPLCVALIVTRHAKELGLPLAADELLTDGGGQVKNLGKSNVQAILKEHSIDRVLAEEGGRTSRGSIRNMRAYVSLLNKLHLEGSLNLDEVENWWIGQVRSFFSGKPFTLKLDTAKSLRATIRDLLDQAEKRQKESSGTTYVGTVIQHLVGAKLELIVGAVEHHGASVADKASGRVGDFLMGDTAIHVTTMPSEALIRKCENNLSTGLKPIIVTIDEGTAVAHGLAKALSLGDRIDVLDIEQFLTGNIYEHGRFELDGRRDATERLIKLYNEIVSKHETDPSLQIIIGK